MRVVDGVETPSHLWEVNEAVRERRQLLGLCLLCGRPLCGCHEMPTGFVGGAGKVTLDVTV